MDTADYALDQRKPTRVMLNRCSDMNTKASFAWRFRSQQWIGRKTSSSQPIIHDRRHPHTTLFWQAEPVHAERVDIIKILKRLDADEIKGLGSPAAIQLYLSSNTLQMAEKEPDMIVEWPILEAGKSCRE